MRNKSKREKAQDFSVEPTHAWGDPIYGLLGIVVFFHLSSASFPLCSHRVRGSSLKGRDLLPPLLTVLESFRVSFFFLFSPLSSRQQPFIECLLNT